MSTKADVALPWLPDTSKKREKGPGSRQEGKEGRRASGGPALVRLLEKKLKGETSSVRKQRE